PVSFVLPNTPFFFAPQRRTPLEARSRSLSQIGGGRWPTSLVEWGAEGALPPRPTERGRQGGRAARRRRSQRDPLARSPATPARIPSPGSPGLADGQGSWRGPAPASNKGKRPLRHELRGA